MKNSSPKLKDAIKFISQYIDKKHLDDLINHLIKTFRGRIPNAVVFQGQHTRAFHDESYFTPRETLRKIKEIVDFYFPEEKYRDTMILNKRDDGTKYILFNRGEIPNNQIPIRIIAAFICLKHITNLANLPRKGFIISLQETFAK